MPTLLLSFKSTGRSVFDLESGKNFKKAVMVPTGGSVFELDCRNQNIDGQTDGCLTHQSNIQVGDMQPAQK